MKEAGPWIHEQQIEEASNMHACTSIFSCVSDYLIVNRGIV